MSRAARFLLVLLVGIGALTWGAYVSLTRTTRDWFVGDVDLRARLAARSAHRALTRRWADGDVNEVREILAGITRDKRIMGARACTTDGAAWISTEAFPQDFSCSSKLVAKEFVAARDDERGVLVLSQFTGAARELAQPDEPPEPSRMSRGPGEGSGWTLTGSERRWWSTLQRWFGEPSPPEAEDV